MIWITILATIAFTGLLLLWHEGGSVTEEPIVTAYYMVWPLVLIVVVLLALKDSREDARDLRPTPTPKDLN